MGCAHAKVAYVNPNDQAYINRTEELAATRVERDAAKALAQKGDLPSSSTAKSHCVNKETKAKEKAKKKAKEATSKETKKPKRGTIGSDGVVRSASDKEREAAAAKIQAASRGNAVMRRSKTLRTRRSSYDEGLPEGNEGGLSWNTAGVSSPIRPRRSTADTVETLESADDGDRSGDSSDDDSSGTAIAKAKAAAKAEAAVRIQALQRAKAVRAKYAATKRAEVAARASARERQQAEDARQRVDAASGRGVALPRAWKNNDTENFPPGGMSSTGGVNTRDAGAHGLAPVQALAPRGSLVASLFPEVASPESNPRLGLVSRADSHAL
jgi:hypothetical protein